MDTAGLRTLLEQARGEGLFSGAACCVVAAGAVVAELYVGTQAAWADDGQPLAAGEQRPVDARTLFDLASVTKVFTAHTALSLVAQGVYGLDEPIAGVLPAYAQPGRDRVTLRHLLTHTAGLPATWGGWQVPLAAYLATRPGERLTASPLAGDRGALVRGILAVPLLAAPGEQFLYSCLGYITTQLLFETLTGRTWRDLTRATTLDPAPSHRNRPRGSPGQGDGSRGSPGQGDGSRGSPGQGDGSGGSQADPLGLADVTADPEPGRCAATEFQPEFGRGVVRGVVHDETAWSLGGGCGNAGLFASLPAVARFAETIRQGTDEVTGHWMWDDALTPILGRAAGDPATGYGMALGLRIGDPSFMGTRRHARGHTGFTGTSLVIERDPPLTVVLLTNRVHPTREGDGIRALRAQVADAAAALVGA